MGRDSFTWSYPVHPRAGGEHDLSTSPPRWYIGSSPRGRGTHVFGRRRNSDDRFIPARAGNTRRRTASSVTGSVHPRAGGEHLMRLGAVMSRTIPAGSSPRGRGTPGLHLRGQAEDRFIPARAGNTHFSVLPLFRPTVHPRAGGEHLKSGKIGRVNVGSSPRGRGTLFSQPSDSANLF